MGILEQADSFLGTDDLEVDVEYEAPFISQFPITAIDAFGDELVIRLGIKHTACLAEEKCLPPKTISFKPLPTLERSKCC